ncbi:hypothetical protein T310_8131, partial [Rasamsonia emersonii CBS 393.64]
CMVARAGGDSRGRWSRNTWRLIDRLYYNVAILAIAVAVPSSPKSICISKPQDSLVSSAAQCLVLYTVLCTPHSYHAGQEAIGSQDELAHLPLQIQTNTR